MRHSMRIVIISLAAGLIWLTGCSAGTTAPVAPSPPTIPTPPSPEDTPGTAPDTAGEQRTQGAGGALEEPAMLGELPPGFPEDIPIPRGAFVWNSSTYEGSDGSVDMTVGYYVGAKPIDVFYFYQDYLLNGDWDDITYGNEGEDPNPYMYPLDIAARKGDVSLAFAMGRDGPNRDELEQTYVDIYYEVGNVYGSGNVEETWRYRNDDLWESTRISSSFDQSRWRNQRIYDVDHLPDGWPREFHVPAPYLRSYNSHETRTEPSSHVQVSGSDDGTERLVFTYSITGPVYMPYQVHKGALNEAGFTLVYDPGDGAPFVEDAGVDEPIELLGVRNGEALHVVIWQRGFDALTELIYDEQFDPAFYDHLDLNN